MLLSLLVLGAPRAGPGDLRARAPAPTTLTQVGLLSEGRLRRMEQGLGPGGRAVLVRLDHKDRPLESYRPAGWERFDFNDVPTLGFRGVGGDDARRINAAIPRSPSRLEFGKPFLAADLSTLSGQRALHCLTQAVYFETGRDGVEAQEAVAQVVLNRVRHPAYPASVCAVVYQGSARVTGCQFSFTCDGSLKRGLMPSAWARAERVARRALRGFVMKDVGVATHYHADYVAPYWASTLVKINQVGPHIFYRWTGPLGRRAALAKRYSGNETNIAREILASWDERTQGLEGAVPLRQAAEARAKAVMALEEAGLVAKVQGSGRIRALMNPERRQPSPEEIKAINDKLAAFEQAMDAPVDEVAEQTVEGPAAEATSKP